MILLDTNVLSELARPEPHAAVAAWARQIATGRLCTSTVSEAELLLGVALMPLGRRRDTVAEAVDRVFKAVIGGRVLSFDRAAAQTYANIAARRRRAGRPVGTFDVQIAAIAFARRLDAIATRNVTHFEDCGVPVIDPWNAP